MKNFFCVYPHCFLTANDSSVLIFNPKTKEYVIGRDDEMASFVHTKSSYVLQENAHCRNFLKEAESKHLGYFIHSENQSPYLAFQEFSFLSSWEKTEKPLWKLPTLVKVVSIHLNNIALKKYDTSTYIQFDYPIYSKEFHNLGKIEGALSELVNFPALECIRLCGDIDNTLLKAIEKIDCMDSQLVVRTSANNINGVVRIKDQYPRLKAEILVADIDDLQKLRQHALYLNEIQVFYLISNIGDLKLVQKEIGQCRFIPILCDAVEQHDLVSQMRLSLDDILASNSSMYDCLSKDYFHKECFGNISLNINGNIFCQNERIGNICNASIIELLDNWLRREDCLWMLTRNKFPSCRNCVLSSLCPSVSIYERQGIIPSACSDNTYEYLQRFV